MTYDHFFVNLNDVMSKPETLIDQMFQAGAHFGLGRSRRNPSAASFIFSTKNKTDIFDLEKTQLSLKKALEVIGSLSKENKVVVFVGGKREASAATKSAAQSLGMPYVDGRWIGGTLTNFGQIRKRIDRYEKLVSDKEKGELSKYTKRERMLIDKEIAKLEKMFFGIVSMKKIPDAMVVIDPRYEKNAIAEADHMKIPVIALASSDCDLSSVKYPVPGNDASKQSISFFLGEIAKAYQTNKIVK